MTQHELINEIFVLLHQINDPAINHYVQDAKDACTQIEVPIFRHNSNGFLTQGFALVNRLLGSWQFMTAQLPVGQPFDVLKTIDDLGELTTELYKTTF